MRFLVAVVVTAMYAVITYYVILSIVYSAGWGLSLAVWLAIGGLQLVRRSSDSSLARLVAFLGGPLPWFYGLGRLIFRSVRAQEV